MLRIFVFILLFFGIVACDDSYKSNIPFSKVNFEVDLLNLYSNLKTANQFVEITRVTKYGEAIGYSGLIVGQSYFHGYCAFDRCCPVEADRKVTLRLEDNGEGCKAVCDKCGSIFDLNNTGALVSGEQRARLMSYSVQLLNDNLLLVYNY